ncbi:hypothetical protein [Flammeovirga sp. OC4]|uniref:hypothetical protein n=1 Tax=Flammeovirga sp. OC4 TaxID=1382345 RepID=UPI0005C4F16C|nr:hypothetical protein [Flammeovirga sp. OC4]
MKYNLFLIFIFLFFSCKNNEVVEFGKKYSENVLLINIDTLDNYKKMFNAIDSTLCNNDDSQVQLIIHDNEVNYKIYLVNYCSDDIVCFSSRNFLYVDNDSVFKFYLGTYSFDSLSSLIKRDYSNNGVHRRLSEVPNKFILSFTQPNSLKNVIVKEKLIRTLNAFKSTNLKNDNLKLNLRLNWAENVKYDTTHYDSIDIEIEHFLKFEEQ